MSGLCFLLHLWPHTNVSQICTYCLECCPASGTYWQFSPCLATECFIELWQSVCKTSSCPSEICLVSTCPIAVHHETSSPSFSNKKQSYTCFLLTVYLPPLSPQLLLAIWSSFPGFAFLFILLHLGHNHPPASLLHLLPQVSYCLSSHLLFISLIP